MFFYYRDISFTLNLYDQPSRPTQTFMEVFLSRIKSDFFALTSNIQHQYSSILLYPATPQTLSSNYAEVKIPKCILFLYSSALTHMKISYLVQTENLPIETLPLQLTNYLP